MTIIKFMYILLLLLYIFCDLFTACCNIVFIKDYNIEIISKALNVNYKF